MKRVDTTDMNHNQFESLPIELVKTIFSYLPARYYFNIHSVSVQFRRVLKKEIYHNKGTLNENVDDDLLGAIFTTDSERHKNRDEILSMIVSDDCPYIDRYDTSLLRAMLHFGYAYGDLYYMLRAACKQKDCELYIHIGKWTKPLTSNYYYHLYKSVPHKRGEGESELHCAIVENILEKPHSFSVSRLAQSALGRHNDSLLDRLIATGLVTDAKNILPILVARNDIERVRALLNMNTYSFHYHTRLKRHCIVSYQIEMDKLLVEHRYNAHMKIKLLKVRR